LHGRQQLAPPGSAVEEMDCEIQVHEDVHGQVGDYRHPSDGGCFMQLVPVELRVRGLKGAHVETKRWFDDFKVALWVGEELTKSGVQSWHGGKRGGNQPVFRVKRE
jgi:hypothetical protein